MNPSIQLVLPAAVAAVLALILTPLAARVAVRVGAIDVPDTRKVHSHPIPRLGGLAVVASIAAVWCGCAFLFGISLPRELTLGVSLGVLPILAVSAIDDIAPVHSGIKLLVHVIGAAIAVGFGVSLAPHVHLFDISIEIGVFAAPLSALWLIGLTNAFNIIDGLDGLSAGLALIASVGMAAVFALVGQPAMAGAALVLAGGLAGFLPYNLHPARLFLGDSGATAIGFCLAALALKGGSTLSSGFAALVPVFIMGLPVADTLITMARRAISRLETHTGGLLVPDRNHIHHRLLALGIDHGRAVLILYAAGLLFAAAAFGSMFLTVRHAALFIIALLIAAFIGIRRLGYHEFAFIRNGTVLRMYETPVVRWSMFVVIVDLAMSAFAAYVALGLKLDTWSLHYLGALLIDLVGLFAPLTALVFWYSGMYRGGWRSASVADLARACGSACAVAGIGALVHPLWSPLVQPNSVFLIYGLVSVVMVATSRASYVVLLNSQHRASTNGVPVLLYGAGQHGIAAVSELFDNPQKGLRPIGFVDDSPGKRGRLLAGLPVLGTSHDLESLIKTHAVQAVLVTANLQPECAARAAAACDRARADLYRMRVQLEPIVEAAARQTPAPSPSQPVRPAAAVAVVAIERCARCGGANVHRSRIRGAYERLRKLHTPTRPFRCDDCGWRGWLQPLERATPLEPVRDPDLTSLDVAFAPALAGRVPRLTNQQAT